MQPVVEYAEVRCPVVIVQIRLGHSPQHFRPLKKYITDSLGPVVPDKCLNNPFKFLEERFWNKDWDTLK